MQPNREGPTVKNMVDNLCQEHDTYPFDTNKHFSSHALRKSQILYWRYQAVGSGMPHGT